MAKYYSRNKKGQFTQKASAIISEELRDAADEIAVRIKPIIRDEFEKTYRKNLYESYEPITEHGKETKEYNEYAKYHIAAPYHHTGILASNVKGVIDGNAVGIKIDHATYPNGKTTEDVYNFLTKGTKKGKKAKNKHRVYEYNGMYVERQQTPKHTFEQDTLRDMNTFLDELLHGGLKNRANIYIKKYKSNKY